MNTVRILIVIMSLAAIAMHAPGQWSVDTVVSLGEALEGRAVGWGSPFFSAVLSWLGGGEAGAATLAALMAFAWGSLLIGLTRGSRAVHRQDIWRVALVVLIVANPMLWLYVGIVWKDVLLGTLAASAIWLFDEGNREGRTRWRWWLPATILLAALPLVRQQGILLTVIIGAAFVASSWFRGPSSVRLLSAGALITGVMAFSAAWSGLANRTVSPPERSPYGVGFLTVMSYDILGTIANSRTHPQWANVEPRIVATIRAEYSPERIDLTWRDPLVAHWIQQRSAQSIRDLWWTAIREEPAAYLAHRVAAARMLFGFSSMKGCVPGYWGVAGPPEVLTSLRIDEAMDPRDRWIGRITEGLSDTPFLRHWFYMGICGLVLIALLKRRRWSDAPAWAAACGAIVYAASFLPTTIACDFRYLYPAAALSLVSGLWLVMDGLRHSKAADGAPR